MLLESCYSPHVLMLRQHLGLSPRWHHLAAEQSNPIRPFLSKLCLLLAHPGSVSQLLIGIRIPRVKPEPRLMRHGVFLSLCTHFTTSELTCLVVCLCCRFLTDPDKKVLHQDTEQIYCLTFSSNVIPPPSLRSRPLFHLNY